MTANTRKLSVLSLFALSAIFCAASAQSEERGKSQPGTQWTEKQLKEAVAPMRAGRNLAPKSWPNGARVAVCLSWDIDNETIDLASGRTAPIALSRGEYGAKAGLPRILKIYDRHKIPGSFYIPAVTGILHPQIIEEFKKRPQHEVGIHGWIHENPATLDNRAEEARLLRQSIDFWTKALGKKPVGYRAPYWAFSAHTLDLIRASGFLYDSSGQAMDDPYEVVSNGKPTGLIELPVSWHLDDAPYFYMPGGGVQPSPEVTFKVYQDEFDRAYEEGASLFMLTFHPMISGYRAHMVHFEKLIVHMKSKQGVWFATGQQIAEYVKKQSR